MSMGVVLNFFIAFRATGRQSFKTQLSAGLAKATERKSGSESFLNCALNSIMLCKGFCSEFPIVVCLYSTI